MPSLLLHLTAVDRLAIHGQRLPNSLARALSEDPEYARLGAALPDLPLFGGLRGALTPFRIAEPFGFARLFHERAPATLCFKMAELIANGALVGREPGLAFVAGYVTHLCVDRALNPLIDTLAARLRQPGESLWRARARIAFAQALLLHRDFYGEDLLGEDVLRSKFQMSKRPGPPRAMGRGLYELVRVSCQAALGEAPKRGEVDSWVRGAYLYGALLSGPWGRVRRARARAESLRRVVWVGSGVDVPAALEQALDRARGVLTRVGHLIERGRFSPRTHSQFIELFEDAPLTACAA